METSKFTGDNRFGELLSSVLALIYGKLKCLDVLYGAREGLPGSTGRADKTMEDFIADGTYNEKYAKFKHCLSIHLSKEGQLGIEESMNVIDNAMSIYVESTFSKGLQSSSIPLLSNTLNHFPNLTNKVRNFYHRFFYSSNTEIPHDYKYRKDLEDIRLFVLSNSTE